jgi:Rrf2 family transcriptional regulator, cysteine metabolism repressor
MKLSTRGDYAVRALLELATAEDGEAMPLTAIAARTNIPYKYLEQILMKLRTARVIRGKRGRHGGYSLARSADQITVGEVVRAMDGPLAPSLCASHTAHSACPAYRCPSEDSCVMRGLWVEVRDAIANILDETTFGDLARRTQEQRSLKREMYHI